ncbi:DeoR family transcriptional regulator [Salmonella sp. NW758]|uniref:helix-turn-helix transcriptional regulator n=1 Tax=unclassified Salmonella TaxID=2614656 RepID=UPI003F434D4B|nr:WYL domain-containing protein [Salmonella enterica]HBM0348116.1 WYL domain-containing protein [Salmonella enterica]HBM0567081.1 WYL domain-containing protein [Salmonella enterica]HBM0609686.1 WYL domain-containing protein [Salmonella enterica]HBM0637688.1 WYL domain-containing protein [Salmonella enterica]
MTLITQENEHDRLATRLSIILSRLFQGEKLHIGTLAEEFGVTTRTLRRDFNVRLTYLDIEQSNGVYQLASHYFRRRTERDMKILARLLHLDRLLPAMDAKLLSLMLDGERPSPYRIMLPEPRQKPTLFGDFSRLTLAILNQTQVRIRTDENVSHTVHPYRLLCSHAEWFLAGCTSSGVFVISLSRIRLVEVLSDTTFEIDNTLISLIEQSDFMEALPHMNIIHQIMHYGSKQTNNRN